ncbi:MAG: HAD-IC family P-type ATPase, partial [bacterium]|nr:HAD-IC family P-type ATPase [bacterium]
MAIPEQTSPPPVTTTDPWFRKSVDESLKALDTTPESGLTDSAVQARLQQYGPNELVEKPPTTVWEILWEQLTNPLVLLLIGAAAVSALLGKVDSFIAIVAIVIINAVLGVTQEYRAEQAMAALKRMAAPLVRVRRDRRVQDVQSSTLVPGDIILLDAGTVVPADARLVEAANLRVAEAALTGESQPVEKSVEAIISTDVPLGDRHNMLFMGTSVTYGRGVAVVTDTGMKTELGKIADLLQNVEQEKTPMQKRIDEVGIVLFRATIAILIFALIVGLATGQEFLPQPGPNGQEESVLLTAVSIAVAVVPEGLPAVVTVALALGAQRMLRRRALIRKLPAVETLGSVTTICSDKTGTLTENRMTVRVVDVAGNYSELEEVLDQGRTHLLSYNGTTPKVSIAQAILLTGNALCNDAELQPAEADAPGKMTFQAIGDPTEGALVVAAARFGLSKSRLDAQYPRVAEVPFDSDRKRMSTIHRIAALSTEATPEERSARKLFATAEESGEYVSFTKGGVDAMLAACDYVWMDGGPVPMTAELRARVEAANNKMAEEGLRVLGLGYRKLRAIPAKPTPDNVEDELIFVGMVGIIDPPRAEVKAAVEVCRQAGIRPVMITGDHPLTALAIARELKIANEGDRVLTGNDLVKMTQQEIEGVVETVPVFARVAPEH